MAGPIRPSEALAEKIAALPPRSAQRSRLFSEMHAALSAAQRGEAYGDWQQRLENARTQAERQKDLFDRELFYAIQPAERLRGMIKKYQQAM